MTLLLFAAMVLATLYLASRFLRWRRERQLDAYSHIELVRQLLDSERRTEGKTDVREW